MMYQVTEGKKKIFKGMDGGKLGWEKKKNKKFYEKQNEIFTRESL